MLGRRGTSLDDLEALYRNSFDVLVFVPSRFVIGMESEELALLPVRARNALRRLTWSEGTHGAAAK